MYNEYIYDLLEPSSGHLDLREDASGGCQAAGLKHVAVSSSAEILRLLVEGNSRRKTEATDANAVSSRSHAVLEILVRRRPRNHHRAQVLTGKLALVDLAGSERASDTNNVGQKLRDGANINRSLLALANCINALGQLHKKGLQAYVPYRNSKLTRLLSERASGPGRPPPGELRQGRFFVWGRRGWKRGQQQKKGQGMNVEWRGGTAERAPRARAPLSSSPRPSPVGAPLCAPPPLPSPPSPLSQRTD